MSSIRDEYIERMRGDSRDYEQLEWECEIAERRRQEWLRRTDDITSLPLDLGGTINEVD